MLSICVCVLAFGCSQKAAVQKGDTLEVTQELREKAVVQPEDELQERFTVVLPTGTKLEVIDEPNVSSSFMNVRVVGIEGNSDQDYINQQLVPERVITKEAYQGFYISLPLDYVGEKVKKAE